MKKYKREVVLKLLQSHSELFGEDVIIKSPLDIIQDKLALTQRNAMRYLRDLQRCGDIDRRWAGECWESIRLITIDGNEASALHELDERERIIEALWKFRTASNRHPGKEIVHENFFDNIISEADIAPSFFYRTVQELEEQGLLTKTYKSKKNRVQYITLSKNFSKALPI